MAKSSHVPEFGNWDSDNNVPYTDYFENARKQKSGVKMINPNDPEENPEAFMAHNTRRADKNTNNNNNNNNNNSHGHHHDHLQVHKRINSAHQNSTGSSKSNTSESISDDQKSSSDYSLLRNRRARISERKKSDRSLAQEISSEGFPQLAQGQHTRHTSGSNIINHSSADSHHRATSSIPKFGAWNEADPKTGEGFTAIFEKVKVEKQIASTTFPAAPPQPCNYVNARTKRGRSSSKSPKMYCCLFSKESE